MRLNDLLNEAHKQVSASEVDAFVKGAKWILDSMFTDDINCILEDSLPAGSIVLERFPNGSPKVILGPNLGNHTQSEAIRVANKGLWHLPSIEELINLYDKHQSTFMSLCNDYLNSCSSSQNGSWVNPMVLNLHTGRECHVFKGWEACFPTRAIIDLS